MNRPDPFRIIVRATVLLTAYVVVSFAAGGLLDQLHVEGALALAFASTPVWFASAEWCWEWVRRGDPAAE